MPWWRRGPRIPSALLLAALLLVLPMSRETDSFFCADCGSHRAGWRLWWGFGGRWIPLLGGSTVRPTRTFEEYFDAGHEHRFPLGNGRVEGVLLVNTVVSGGLVYCGTLLPNDFLRAIEESDPFHARMRERVAAGEVSREEVRRLCGLAVRYRMWRQGPVPPGTHDLVRRANGWLAEARLEPLWEESEAWPPQTTP